MVSAAQHRQKNRLQRNLQIRFLHNKEDYLFSGILPRPPQIMSEFSSAVNWPAALIFDCHLNREPE
jgi:hypothetical protein